jgi:hypothetical protein
LGPRGTRLSPMPTSEDYRRRAAETRHLATATQDIWEREALLRMAAQWERLAEHKAKRNATVKAVKIQTETLPQASALNAFVTKSLDNPAQDETGK